MSPGSVLLPLRFQAFLASPLTFGLLDMASASEHGVSLPFHQFSEKATLGERAAQGKVVCDSCNTQISDFY